MEKTYISRHPGMQAAYSVGGKTATIHFKDGKYTTSDIATQKHIEGLSSFGTVIMLGPSAKEVAIAKARSLRAIANKAAAEAKAAEDALVATDAPKKKSSLW